jgi:folylpolyglutamate synthase/dihydropteroate synthase
LLTLVTAAMADKDVDGVVSALSRATALQGSTVIATSLDLPRSMTADELAARWRTLGAARTITSIAEADPIAAIERALERALERSGPVVVAGSLYLVGMIRGYLVGEQS